MSSEPPQGGDPQSGSGGSQGGQPDPGAGGQHPARPGQYDQGQYGSQADPQAYGAQAGAGPEYGGASQQQPGRQQPGGQQSYQQPYGQQPYGQPQYGQYGQQGQPQYGQQGQQPYGQDQYGQDPYGGRQYGAQPYPSQQPYGGGPQYGGAQPYGGPPPPGAYPAPAGGPLPTGTSPDPLVPFSFGDWVSKIIGTVQRSWKPLAIIQVAVFVPVAILSAVLTLVGLQGVDSTGRSAAPDLGALYAVSGVGLLLLLVAVVLGSLGQAASVFVVVRDAARRPYTSQQTIAFARSRALPVIGWSLLAGLLVTVGFVLLIIPGIYLATVFGGALLGVVVVERAGIGRSFALVNPRFFPVLGRLVLLLLVALVYGLVTGLLATPVSILSPVLGQLVSNLLALPIAVVSAAAIVVTYAENRFHEHNPVHTPVLADEIDRP